MFSSVPLLNLGQLLKEDANALIQYLQGTETVLLITFHDHLPRIK